MTFWSPFFPSECIISWSVYHLRWWLVDQSLRRSGRGIFEAHPSLTLLYFRLLGAHIGKDVSIAKNASLGEYDLLHFEDGCRVDKSLVRGFCVERDGYFRLDHVVVGRNAVINTYTQLSPGSVIPPDAVLGPHASSHEESSPKHYSVYNRTAIREPHWMSKLLVAYPIFLCVLAISCAFLIVTSSLPDIDILHRYPVVYGHLLHDIPDRLRSSGRR